jgi:hypothetical protein
MGHVAETRGRARIANLPGLRHAKAVPAAGCSTTFRIRKANGAAARFILAPDTSMRLETVARAGTLFHDAKLGGALSASEVPRG